jgi:hypothetical protein
MLKNKLKSLLVALSLSPILVGFWYLPSQAQTPQNSSSEKVTRVISITKDNGENTDIEISGRRDRVDQAASVAATLLSAGVAQSGVKVSIDLVLAGADPEAVGNLELSLSGLVPTNGDVNINQLNQAITAYNTILDKADTQTLQTISKNTLFIDTGFLLKQLRKPLG